MSWRVTEKILWLVIQLKSFVLQLHIEFSCLRFSDTAHHRVGLHWCKDILLTCIVSDQSSKRDSQERPAQLNQTKIHFLWTGNLGLKLKAGWSFSTLRKHILNDFLLGSFSLKFTGSIQRAGKPVLPQKQKKSRLLYSHFTQESGAGEEGWGRQWPHKLQQAHTHYFKLTFHSKLGKEWAATPDQNKLSEVLNSWSSGKNQTWHTSRGNQTSQKEILLEPSTKHCLCLYSSLGKHPFLEKGQQLSQCQRWTSKSQMTLQRNIL